MSQNILKDIVKNYFSRKYLYKELNNAVVGDSGQKWNFDAIIKVENDGSIFSGSTFGVFIKDWNRSIGVNQVRLLEKACIDMSFSGGLLIGNSFSGHAKTYGRSKGIQIITKSELLYKYKYS